MVRIAISQNDIKWWPKKSVLSKGKKAMAAIYRVNKKNSSISHQLSYVIQLWMKWSGKRTLSLGWIVGLFYFSFHLIGRFQDTMNLYGNIDGELAWKIIHTSPSPTHTHTIYTIRMLINWIKIFIFPIFFLLFHLLSLSLQCAPNLVILDWA